MTHVGMIFHFFRKWGVEPESTTEKTQTRNKNPTPKDPPKNDMQRTPGSPTLSFSPAKYTGTTTFRIGTAPPRLWRNKGNTWL